ncbi:hypothetical protein SAMN05720468_10416 [Fibrobacter sp. UWEL]|nr:hypothetical protein SAMN05720468_10416 [Fibrobacter sp. UWEL]
MYLRYMFQFTHPRGVRSSGVGLPGLLDVSIHAPTRGAMWSQLGWENDALFQFTHPRGVRFQEGGRIMEVNVSIHAPTRGAIDTGSKRKYIQGFNSRTHAGCDHFVDDCIKLFLFQFTHPRGVRSLFLLTLPQLYVSIHAPTRGAIVYVNS